MSEDFDALHPDLTHYVVIGDHGGWGKGKTWAGAVAAMNRRIGYREKNFSVFHCHRSTVVNADGNFEQEAGHPDPDHCGQQVVLNFTGRIDLNPYLFRSKE